MFIFYCKSKYDIAKLYQGQRILKWNTFIIYTRMRLDCNFDRIYKVTVVKKS